MQESDKPSFAIPPDSTPLGLEPACWREEGEKDLPSRQLQSELQAIAVDVRAIAKSYQANNLALLELLRTLERLHREICEGVFQMSLPDNRQDLYSLLRDIEESGGWPYIERMKLQALLVNLATNSPESQTQP